MKRPKHRLYLLYRLQQRLAITESELRAMIALLAFLLIGTLVKSYQERHPPFDEAIYAEADSLFLAAVETLQHAASQQPSTAAVQEESDTTALQLLISSAGKVNLNTSTQQELEQLPRIGPAMARRIIAYRTAYGPFRTKDDLLNVKGIGEKTLERLKDRITLD